MKLATLLDIISQRRQDIL